MLSEISQTEKDKYCTVSLTCGVKINKQTKLISQKQRIEQWLPGTGGGRQKWGDIGERVQIFSCEKNKF